MSLTIYYSDKIEDLADKLKKDLRDERENSDPFAFSTVVVPNTNIAKWLQVGKFSDTRELCAGIEFPFMEKRLTDLLRRNLPKDRKFSLLPDNAYANAILAALLEEKHPEFAAFAPFRSYISAGAADASKPLDISTRKSARMAWQLATKLANLMDQYEVRRPKIVENWLARANTDGTGKPKPGSTEAGEAALARALWGPQGAFPDGGERLSLRQLYKCVKGAAPVGDPEKIYFFGMSTLTVLQVKILVWLAKTHEVVFYHNNVCMEYWGDIETRAERIKLLGGIPDDKEDIEIENPLLNQWGAAGRETIRLLVDLEEKNNKSIKFEWKCVAGDVRPDPQKLLGKIQNSIWHRTGKVRKAPQDASLQIVGVPGIRREVEMVYNAILGAVWKPEDSGERPWNECGFSDIAVLVPDMATYRPMIEAVFDGRDEIPYGLVDTTASEDSAYLAGFLALADLARKGLTRETLFALLDNPCVQSALDFSPDDVADWRVVTARIGAFDGFEAREDVAFTSWDWALSRLRLATVADSVTMEACGTDHGEPMPLASVNDRSVLRLSEIVELLHRRIEETFLDAKSAAGDADRATVPWRSLPCGPKPDEPEDSEEPNWRRVLSRLAREFLAVPKDEKGKDDELEGSVRRQIMLTLGGFGALPGEQSAELAIAAVEHFVGGLQCRRGGYLTDGVTIAGLQPMRPVPFRQVFVLGLGEGGFPGRTGAVDMLDMRGTGWKLGDVSLPKANRFLFLETLMAVRDRLVLSYPNRNIEKDAELFPSSIVRELASFAGTITENAPFEELKGYPLLERGERRKPGAPNPVGDVTWSKDDRFAGLVPTYSKTARKTAAMLAGAKSAPVPMSRKKGYPLLERGERGKPGAPNPVGDVTWSKDDRFAGLVPTYSKTTRKTAAMLAGAKSAPVPMARKTAASTAGHARREVSAQELAEFLKEPLHAALEFGFGIVEKGVRDRELNVDSPLGLPSGPVTWTLQSDWLKGGGDLDAPYRKLQLEGLTPAGFLGDFSKNRFEEKVAGGKDALLAFAKEFGFGTEACATMRQSFPYTLSRANGSTTDVLFVSATPNWLEVGAQASVIVAGYLGDSPPRLPSNSTLAPFVAFLMRVAKESQDGVKRTLRVGVIDVEHGSAAAWRWTLDSATAADWLKRLTLRYLDYLEQPDADDRYVDFTYGKLTAALEKNEGDTIDWNAVLDSLTAEEFKPKRGKKEVAPAKSYDSGLVVEQSVGKYRRNPTAAELKTLYDDFYQLPLSGTKEDGDATQGGAQ